MASRRSIAVHVVAAGLLLFALEAVASVDLRPRDMMAAYAVVLIGAALYSAKPLRRLPVRAIGMLAGFFLLSVGLVFVAALFSPVPQAVLIDNLFPTISGWVALLVLFRIDERAPRAPEDWQPRRAHLLLFLVCTATLLALVHAVAVGRWAVFGDETVYLAQSGWMGLRDLAWPMDARIADFFRMRKADYGNGQLFGMYPPGWPALLALFRGVGLEWWSVVVLGTTSVGLLYAIVKRLQGPAAAATAAVLLATSQRFLIAHAGYMSHVATISTSLAATLCLVHAAEGGTRRPSLWWMGAGVLLGFVVTMRPLTGLALGGSIGLWTVYRFQSPSPRLIARFAGCLAIGGALPAALLLAYNASVYGDPFTVGYSAVNGAVYDLGFGQRGVSILDENLVRIPVSHEFTPGGAFGQLLGRVVGLNTTFLPIGMLFPVVAASIAFGRRGRWMEASFFVLLPVAHFFYWFGGLRLYIELLPFMIMGTAGLLMGLRRVRPAFATALFGTLLAGSLVMMLPWPGLGHQDSRRWTQSGYAGRPAVPITTLMRADSLAAEYGPILLFVRDESRFDNLISTLFMFNGRKFDGPVVVARDRGDANAELMRMLPRRVPFLVEDRGRDEPAQFTRLN